MSCRTKLKQRIEKASESELVTSVPKIDHLAIIEEQIEREKYYAILIEKLLIENRTFKEKYDQIVKDHSLS